jgi:hypothetical protein
MGLVSNISPERGKLAKPKLVILNHIPEYSSTQAILKSAGFDFKN